MVPTDSPHPTSPALGARSMDDTSRRRSFRVLGHATDDTYDKMVAKGYAIGQLIGKGGFGAVYAGTKKENGQLIPVALKLIGGWNKVRPPKSTKSYRVGRYQIELRIMSQLEHPNLVYVYDIFLEGNSNMRDWERRTFIWMERSAKDLAKMAWETPGGRLPEGVVTLLMAHALNGLEFLHDNNIAHRDIKPQNILLFDTPQGQISKITDYSLIREVDQNAITTTKCGTPGYQSPTCLFGKYNPFKMDVFAIGIVIFELLVGRRPKWNPQNIRNVITALAELNALHQDVDNKIRKKTVTSLLNTNIFTTTDEARITVKECKANKWFPDVSDHPMYKVPGAIKGFKKE